MKVSAKSRRAENEGQSWLRRALKFAMLINPVGSPARNFFHLPRNSNVSPGYKSS